MSKIHILIWSKAKGSEENVMVTCKVISQWELSVNVTLEGLLEQGESSVTTQLLMTLLSNNEFL